MSDWAMYTGWGKQAARVLALLLTATTFFAFTDATKAQVADCGIANEIGYPVDNLESGYDDFGRFRSNFGGNHTGIDLAFDRWYDPVVAAARGMVTYSDTAGWDTEKGVVIVSHDFPDGSRAYSLYGHVEETDTITLPAVGTCVEMGQIIAAVGWPSRGRPHLHFEFRTILPREGGPGYVSNNPIDGGWFNPLDFIALWRAKFKPAFVQSISFDTVASLPPTQMDSGAYLTASGTLVSAVIPPDQPLWQIQTDTEINGMAALAGDRVVVHTESGQTLTLEGGRYGAIWTVDSAETPFVALGERLIFLMQDGSLNAYDSAGTLIWTLPTNGEVVYFGGNGSELAFAVEHDDGVTWQTLNAEGQGPNAVQLKNAPLVSAEADGRWLVLDGQELMHIHLGQSQAIATLPQPVERTGKITADALGNVYVYWGDSERTMMAIGADGQTRWRIAYPRQGNFEAPLMAAGNGCLLYTLDVDGMMNVINSADGTLVDQIALYAGGRRTTNPAARLLKVDAAEQVYVASGFLTMIVFDGTKLGGTGAECLAG